MVRHGESTSNLAGTLSGSGDNPSLTELGRQQGLQTGENVKASERDIEAIISSPLDRAQQTAELIAQVIGFTGEIELLDLLKERDFGDASGKPKELAFKMLDEGTAVGVESLEDFTARITELIEYLKKRKERHILLVGHAAVAEMFAALVDGVDPKDFLGYKHLGNAEILDLEI